MTVLSTAGNVCGALSGWAAVEATGVMWMLSWGAEGGREEAVGAPPYLRPSWAQVAFHSLFIFVHVKVKLTVSCL